MTLREEIANAFRLHRAGELILAARLYQTILSRDPEQVDVLYLLGVLRQQQGQFAETVELYGKAVALRPGEVVPFQPVRGVSALGQFEQAVGCCRAALTLRRRDYPERTTTSGWPYTLWASLPKRPNISRPPWHSARTTPRHTPTWASPCDRWERSSRRSGTCAKPWSSTPS